VLGAVDGAPIVLNRTSAYLLEGNIGGCERTIAEDLISQHFDDFQSSLHTAMALRAARQVLA
jgi:hypothetical protein